jgi:hypothetical protein
MTFVVKPSRPGSIVAEAFAGLRADERRMDRIRKTYRTKPVVAEPESSKTPKSPRAQGGKRKARR